MAQWKPSEMKLIQSLKSLVPSNKSTTRKNSNLEIRYTPTNYFELSFRNNRYHQYFSNISPNSTFLLPNRTKRNISIEIFSKLPTIITPSLTRKYDPTSLSKLFVLNQLDIYASRYILSQNICIKLSTSIYKLKISIIMILCRDLCGKKITNFVTPIWRLTQLSKL